MLNSLSIKNFILIESVSLDFKSGFTVFTGETGAGKSIILTALGLVLGRKADKGDIKIGAEFAEVTAEFKPNKRIKKLLEESELEAGELIIRRKIFSDGRSKAFVNDSAVSLKTLEAISSELVEIVSQHEQSSLFASATQRQLLDMFAKNHDLLNTLSAQFAKLKDAENNLEEAKQKIAGVKREEDYLRHVLAELSEINPQTGEEAELTELRRRMKNSEKIYSSLREAEAEMNAENIEVAITHAQKILMRANDECFAKAIEALERASIEIGEIFSELKDLHGTLETDPQKLQQAEDRLFAIRELARKYNLPADELPTLKAEIATKLKLVSDEGLGIKELEDELAKRKKEYLATANQISDKRKIAAEKLQTKLLSELKHLAMGTTKFEARIIETEPSLSGIDKVEFIASTNPGQPLKLLADIASGGEISRFMLALKVALLEVTETAAIIFDEIDTGTGGAVAASIGERMAKLGEKMQVFAVTHLPQVAALAQNHIQISKEQGKNKVSVKARDLSKTESHEEIARMLSGTELTPEARAAAEKLAG